MFPLNVIAAAEQEKINLTAQTLTNADNAPGGSRIISGVRINTDGTVSRITQWNSAPFYSALNDPPDWNDIKKNMGNYEAMATSPDSVDFGDALNTWFDLASLSPEWGAERGPPNAGTTTAAITVQIRYKSTSLVKASALYDCVATEL